jgi:hypothetical protein
MFYILKKFHIFLWLFQTVPLSYWINPAERLVQAALNKWRMRLMKADNTSAIVVLIDPLGPRKLSILKKKREERMKEIALQKSHDNHAVMDLLTAKESLTKSPKKVHAKNTVPSLAALKPKLENDEDKKSNGMKKENKTHAHTKDNKTCVIAKEESHAKSQNHSNKVIVSPMHRGSDSLDESVQIRNSHLVSPVPNSHKKHEGKSLGSPQPKASPLQTSSSENLCRTGMATRSSPQKSPESVKNSVNALTNSVNNDTNMHQTRSHAHGTNTVASSLQQKCLQPCKNTSENVKNVPTSKVPHTDLKVKDLVNFYSTDVKLGLRNLNLKNSQKSKFGKNLNNSNAASDGMRVTKKTHSNKSLTTRISMRLRRLRQKTQKGKLKNQSENKRFIAKPGMKRKMEPNQSCGTPASKKIRHS